MSPLSGAAWTPGERTKDWSGYVYKYRPNISLQGLDGGEGLGWGQGEREGINIAI